ncbi:MAG TPA: LacI family DNA-binding transcriptional regulator [Solirubrobacteraceae bacterium]|nr:LacI family DNA-binding transcriptional regulator [Solirubrobacteraceae bacterium]
MRRSGRPATIADVAARAGVGASTVSRVLNGGQVSGPARARVLAAMSELGYRPRASARSLVTGATGALAVVIPFFTHPSAVQRLRGVLAALDATDYELVLCNVATPAQRDDYLGPRAPLDRSDGLLVVSLRPRDDEVEAFLRGGAPVVLLDASHPRLPSLLSDDVTGGLLATRHLLALGHERIAFVGDRPDPGFGFIAGDRRRDGYGRALSEAGLPVRPELQREGPHGRLVAHRLTRELLSLPEPPTAIFAASDTQALGVLEAAGFEGFDVPGDLSVVGFDDLEVAPYVGLTTVRQPLEESGARGIERLLAALHEDDAHPHEERLELELVVRRTTGPPRVARGRPAAYGSERARRTAG